MTGFTGKASDRLLPSQVQPWRMSPTMSDVQRLHLVGVLKVFTTN